MQHSDQGLLARRVHIVFLTSFSLLGKIRDHLTSLSLSVSVSLSLSLSLSLLYCYFRICHTRTSSTTSTFKVAQISHHVPLPQLLSPHQISAPIYPPPALHLTAS